MIDIDNRITAALTAAADTVTEQHLRATPVPPPGRRQWAAPALAAAAVVCLAVGGAIAFGTAGSHRTEPVGAGSPSLSVSASEASAPSVLPISPDLPAHIPGDPACAFWADLGCKGLGWHPYVPLWPYRSTAAYDPGRYNALMPAWHFDAAATARHFVTDYLGFTGLSDTPVFTSGEDEAYIGVGPDDTTVSALVHVVRLERTYDETGAPWEVVGASPYTGQGGSGITITAPDYAGQVDRKVTATVAPSGADARLAVHDLADPAGHRFPCCTVDLGPHAGAHTVVAYAGGTDTAPDLLAITGLYTGKPTGK